MRMPFIEFLTSGDLKFVVVFIIFASIAIYHFFKKITVGRSGGSPEQLDYHNTKIDRAAFWILISGMLSLMLGLMHSFYFIGKAGGIAPGLIFQGISYALITPVLSICLFIICKIFGRVMNPKFS